MKTCRFCGANNDDEYEFCASCGYELEMGEDSVYGAIGRKRKKTSVVISIISLVIGVILILSVLFLYIIPLFTSPNYRTYPLSTEFTVERIFFIQKSGAGTLDYTIDTPVAKDIFVDGKSVQKIKFATYTPQPTKNELRYGYEWLNWSDKLGPVGEQYAEIKIVYTINATLHISEIDEGSTGTIEDIPSSYKEKYNRDEWILSSEDPSGGDRDGDGKKDVMIEPSAEEIRSLAKSLVGDEKNVYRVVKKIYDYMVSNIEYARGGGLPKHALQTLRDSRGDCDDQSFLFASLSRSIGIPAWCEFGALYDSTTETWIGHAWSALYMPLTTGGGEIVYIDTTNKQFLFRDPYRFTIWTDDGVGDHVKDYYYLYTYTTTGVAEGKFEEKYQAINFTSHGRYAAELKDVKRLIPGYEILHIVIGIPIAIVLYRKICDCKN